ncbi:MAG: SRPBCC domain-containing protein [Acidobacteriota bacterium]|nr:SRPBCC domain-containing protein [Acidobacteriota bacterium]
MSEASTEGGAGGRLVFEFKAKAFEPGESTEVEVRFEEVAEGTEVRVEHRGFFALDEAHPARHGLSGGALRSMLGLWWASQLLALRSSRS